MGAAERRAAVAGGTSVTAAVCTQGAQASPRQAGRVRSPPGRGRGRGGLHLPQPILGKQRSLAFSLSIALLPPLLPSLSR